jgi:polysaccharide biosynthesis/export protein VpsN
MNSFLNKVVLSIVLTGLLLLAGGAAGCKSPPRTFPNPEVGEDGEPIQQVVTPDMLRTGDRIVIVFSGNANAPQVPHEEQIREDGYITPPLLGANVMAAGKTIGQLQEELHTFYVPAFFQTLTVTVRSEERYFFVGGQVNKSGQVLYRSEMTVTKAIQVAGDFTDFANRRRVLLTRKDGTSMEVDCRRAIRDSRFDPPVYPGDIIHVPQRW